MRDWWEGSPFARLVEVLKKATGPATPPRPRTVGRFVKSWNLRPMFQHATPPGPLLLETKKVFRKRRTVAGNEKRLLENEKRFLKPADHSPSFVAIP